MDFGAKLVYPAWKIAYCQIFGGGASGIEKPFKAKAKTGHEIIRQAVCEKSKQFLNL